MAMLIIDEKLLKIVLGGIWKNKPVRSHLSEMIAEKIRTFSAPAAHYKGTFKTLVSQQWPIKSGCRGYTQLKGLSTTGI